MKKILLIMVLSNFVMTNAFSLSSERETYEYEQCLQILVNAGKKQHRSRLYCLCSVKKISKKYSDAELNKIENKGVEYLNKKTKSIAKKCAKEANAQ
tara:strand:- start:184 stop:474 length:291 start_codon:yes stop_codon:yes gene_type:complete